MLVSRRCFCHGLIPVAFYGISAGSIAARDGYPVVTAATGARIGLHPVCGNALWSISPKAEIIDSELTPDLIQALKTVSAAMEIKPSVGLIGNDDKPILQVSKITGKKDGIVCVNDLMLKKLRSNGLFGREIIVGLLAHEFTHVLQLRNKCFLNVNKGGFDETSPTSCFSGLIENKGTKLFLELHADFMAGWLMGRLGLLTTHSFSSYTKQIYADGEYLYSHKDHHGTPRVRLNAMADGYWFGKKGELLGFYPNETLQRVLKKADKRSPMDAFIAGQAVLALRKATE